MYLDILLKWGYSIPISAFDAFLYKYPRYMFEKKKGEFPCLHIMFGSKSSYVITQLVGFLNKDVLREIVHENPYSGHTLRLPCGILRGKCLGQRRLRWNLSCDALGEVGNCGRFA